MAFTQDQINSEVSRLAQSGWSYADIEKHGASLGVSGDSLITARDNYEAGLGGGGGGSAAPSPAPAPASMTPTWTIPAGGYTDAQVKDTYFQLARDGVSQARIDEIAAERKVTPEQLAAARTAYEAWLNPKATTVQKPKTVNLATGQLQAPTMWNVGESQTAAGQLSKLLASDSPLMQRARTRAQQDAQARGLLNSTMATTAGEAAMIDSILPVAQQDAGTYSSAAQTNAAAANAFATAANAFERDGAMAEFNLSANDWAADRASERDLAKLQLQQQFAASEAALDRATTKGSQAFTADQAALDRAAQIAAAATTQQQTLERGYINGITQARQDFAEKFAAINSNTGMSDSLKADTIQNLATTYNTLIVNYAGKLGWNAESWRISVAGAAPAPAAAPVSGTAAGASPAVQGGE